MGYRSDVAIFLTNACYVRHKVLENLFPELIKEFDKSMHKNGVLYEMNGVKWYDSYQDVQQVYEWLEQLDDEEYGFIRIGEETEDIEYRGSPGEFGLYINRDICFEEW